MAARCYGRRKTAGWVIDRAYEIAETERLARLAAELGRDDADALANAGISLAYVVGDLDSGADCAEKALVLNPNLAVAWFFGGMVKVWLGQPEVAIERLSRAMRLSPHDPLTFNMQAGIAAAHFSACRYAEALSWAEISIRGQPEAANATSVAAASAALLGNHTAAATAMARLRRLMPDLHLSNIKYLFPIRPADDLARWAEGLRKAGLPE